MNELLPPQIVLDMQAVDLSIEKAIESGVPLIHQVSNHILIGGGKRLRPLLLVLSARLCHCDDMDSVYQLAALIEIIHITTLLHDDVVDASEMRRGQETANIHFGNAASVLVGDFLYSRAFQMMVALDNMPVMRVLSKATNTIAEGEVLQLANIGNTALSEQEYLKVIQYKTAKLFEATAQLGAMLANQKEVVQSALAEYGGYIGTAFQVIDDALDFSGQQTKIGKSLGDDLAEGKVTLPLLFAIKQGSQEQAEFICHALKEADRRYLAQIIDIVNQTGALEKTQECARELIEKAIGALEIFPDSLYKQTLIQLARFVVERHF